MDFLNDINKYINYSMLGVAYIASLKVGLDISKKFRGNSKNLKDLLKHIYVIGQTGTGKTTFLLNEINEYKNHGAVVFIVYKDQDTCNDLLDIIDDETRERVILLDATHPRWKVGFNMYGDDRSSIKNELYVNSMIDTYKTLWGEQSIGASSEDIFRMIMLGVAEMDIRTPLEIYKCLMPEYDDYRDLVESRTENLIVKDFFVNELAEKIKNHAVINPPKNKQRRIVGSPTLLYTLCQTNPLFSMERELNEGKIIIANFNQEKLGAENASFLASLFFSQLQIIGFTRKDKSTPILVLADEFQDYINSSFITFLSQARSFNMSLTLSHQYTSQVPKPIQHAIEGNVASRYYFRVGKTDAQELGKFLDEDFDKDMLVNMKDYHYLSEVIVDGKKQAMKIEKSQKPPKAYDNRKYIIKNSIEKYAVNKDSIDKDVRERLGYGEMEEGGILI